MRCAACGQADDGSGHRRGKPELEQFSSTQITVAGSRPLALAIASTRDVPALTLADTAVLDPARTAQTDVDRVLWAEEIPQSVRASGHVYDIDTGLVTTIVDARTRGNDGGELEGQ